MQQLKNEDKLLTRLFDGPATAADLAKIFGVSQPTVSRLVASLGDKVIQIGRARSSKYARPRDVRSMGSVFPVYQVNQEGNARLIGNLRAIRSTLYIWELASGQYEEFKFLPWFVQDMRPDGFIGRSFAYNQYQELRIPQRLQDWNEDDVLTAVVRRGEDCIGNLIIGDESLDRYFTACQDAPHPPLARDLRHDYPKLAQVAMQNGPAGSSTGGEQPKFVTCIMLEGEATHVLVKFSPPVSTPEGQRWSDLLVCEHLALEVIKEVGYRSATSRILQIGDRTFLEEDRFDRTGRFGRLPMNTLGAIDDQFFGHRDSWVQAADRLEANRMVSVKDAAAMRWQSYFGNLIGNTDQHFGNLSLAPRDISFKTFDLAPAYDMLPMMYAPKSGETIFPEFTPQIGRSWEWGDAQEYAQRFWMTAAADERISTPFREICSQNLEKLRILSNRPRIIA